MSLRPAIRNIYSALGLEIILIILVLLLAVNLRQQTRGLVRCQTAQNCTKVHTAIRHC
jgi:hypothetical protein